MAWDPTRPVPWKRLIREWLIYVTIMAVGFALVFRNQSMIGIIAGLLVSGPLYVGLGAVLAKFGLQRKSFRQARADAIAARSAGPARAATGTSAGRPRPAATKRTGGGNARPGAKHRR